LAIKAIRDAQLILARYVTPGERDAVATVNALLVVLDQDAVIEAVDRLEKKFDRCH
jgi:hypothetical protein